MWVLKKYGIDPSNLVSVISHEQYKRHLENYRKECKLPNQQRIRQQTIVLTSEEAARLMQSETTRSGGFQSLIAKLQKNLNKDTGEINLDGEDIERIMRYAKKIPNWRLAK